VVGNEGQVWVAYIFLLFVDMSDLEPDVFLGERTWRVIDNVVEALSSQQLSLLGLIGVYLRLNFVETFAAACILCRDGSRSRLPFQSPAACA
jgi:hypothetical protein